MPWIVKKRSEDRGNLSDDRSQAGALRLEGRIQSVVTTGRRPQHAIHERQPPFTQTVGIRMPNIKPMPKQSLSFHGISPKAAPVLQPCLEGQQSGIATGGTYQPDSCSGKKGVPSPEFGTPDQPSTEKKQRRRSCRLGVVGVDVAELAYGPPEAPMQQGEFDGVLYELLHDAPLRLRNT